MKSLKRHLPTILLVLIFIVGCGLLIYPTFADWWNDRHQTRAIANYNDTVSELAEEEYDSLWAEAETFNTWVWQEHSGYEFDDEEEAYYESVLDVTDDGIMAYIEIPKIDVYLAIYHGTSDHVLANGVGHLEGTSLPTGGESTHCVLSGHRGLTSARLFTDLDELEEGDLFYIYMLDETLVYEVDQILIVLPTETSALAIEEGEDYVTLMTCTPYGINTHRLLVRGHRIELDDEVIVTADATQVDETSVASVIAVPALLLLLVLVLIRNRKHSKKHRQSKQKPKETREKT